MKNLKDNIRAATLGKSVKPRKISVAINGEHVEVRQPTLRQRNDLRDKCMVSQDDTLVADAVLYQIWGVILFCYVPGTDERVFDEGDFDSLANQPSGSFVDDLFEAFIDLSSVDISNEKKS